MPVFRSNIDKFYLIDIDNQLTGKRERRNAHAELFPPKVQFCQTVDCDSRIEEIPYGLIDKSDNIQTAGLKQNIGRFLRTVRLSPHDPNAHTLGCEHFILYHRLAV